MAHDRLTKETVERYVGWCESDQAGTIVELSRQDFLELAKAWLAVHGTPQPVNRPYRGSQGLRQAV